MKAAILGSTGYTGLVLLRFLLDHPEIDEIIPVSSSSVGLSITEYDPGIFSKSLLTKVKDGLLKSVDDAKLAKPDVVFAALPHLKSAEICSDFFGDSVIIDLSADFRIEDAELFEKAYGEKHPNPKLQKEAVYGLSEWYKDKIKNAQLIANPGCYPTASLLPLLPLVKEGIITNDIVINALSGISGAGRSAKPNSLFVKRNENANAYNIGTKHRHQIEIKKELDFIDNYNTKVIFNPHLIPLSRGMVVTTVAKLQKEVTDSKILEIYTKYYGNSEFVNILKNSLPESGSTINSNRCDISWQLEDNSIILCSTIDNLVKGASGQAVQNMNIRFGFKESLGLSLNGEL
ncbi:N-acetyl-gamma-glutamyl-phosphate reductase [Thiospirochaeta perfilievii]|uniref:N-acetyl-gamma-glutamyl-phosphate reductase n=1 Tax=Thiospirochaeta perfilievii TaxID=252967 RepID=A0A5C1QC61_9SPIO|nr:N-acetyl-gamma-glutamyl-phosphate reductase [Thiospirochaeta perfilievii]QEN04256.1 N-acetyl-gamma-glutamyl-phosphate reductase [Thiospirochaeta perfilievii]